MLYKLTETHYFLADSDEKAELWADCVEFGKYPELQRASVWERVYFWSHRLSHKVQRTLALRREKE